MSLPRSWRVSVRTSCSPRLVDRAGSKLAGMPGPKSRTSRVTSVSARASSMTTSSARGSRDSRDSRPRTPYLKALVSSSLRISPMGTACSTVTSTGAALTRTRAEGASAPRSDSASCRA